MQHAATTANTAARSILGQALRDRAANVADDVLAQAPGLRELVDYTLATEILGRWLATGDGATQEELDRIVHPGLTRRCFSIETFCAGFGAWRDVVFAILRQEATRHGIGERDLNEIDAITSSGLDASLIRSSRMFDKEHERLEQELLAERARLAHEALHDPLTGLPNRMLLSERAQHSLAAARRHDEHVALLFIDLDGFKEVNDRLGHSAGDTVLRQAASRISGSVRPYDTVARLGGDELVVLCERLTSRCEAHNVLERTLLALSEPYELPGHSAVVGASIGIAFNDDVKDAAELIAAADSAMYLAKRRGGGQCAHAHEAAIAA